ncbi:MAG: TetR/AcrR family transcriptional regulator [bacterium]|nr:TetR/AcrR family transcriptional regulator [bacterium]
MARSDDAGRAWGADDASAQLVDQSGRVLGPRALETRQKLLAATKHLLDTKGLREVRVMEIAHDVGSSPATFYQYFKDIEEAVLALCEQASRQMPAVAELLSGSWAGEAGLESARALVSAFIDHWDQHHAVLRVRNLASDEGDTRFRAVRARAMSPVLRGLARLMEDAQERAQISRAVDPLAAAAAMAAILERMATYHRELATGGVSREQLVESSARILHRSVTGEGLL